ncbi:hypothetical protein ACWCY1_33745 [Streptomyces goshikiensis]|uniref:hypothetical protein n=1 Tax=Streptomyces goshikiensis TaxID=1942 RepID=UPI0036576046
MNASAARTYDEIINDDRAPEEDKRRAKADSLLGHMAALLFQRGHLQLVQQLRQVRAAGIEYDPQDQTLDLWLDFDPADFAGLSESAQDDLREVFERVSRRLAYGIDWIGFRETMPSVGHDWREQLDGMLNGNQPTNQARRAMPETPKFLEDCLAFTNAGEMRVYRALKHLQEKELPPEETISILCPSEGSPVVRARPTSSSPTRAELACWRSTARTTECAGPWTLPATTCSGTQGSPSWTASRLRRWTTQKS